MGFLHGKKVFLNKNINYNHKPYHNIYLLFSKIKNPIIGELFVFLVAPAGIEPATQGFSVLCSTD